MIRVPLNLASEPFVPSRAPRIALAAAYFVLGVALVVQVSVIVASRGQAANERIQIALLNEKLASLGERQSALSGNLRQPRNAEVLERSLLLNALIERKAISWTRLFADLEQVFPYNVRLISVRLPQIDTHNRVLLDMIVGANEPGPVLELLKHLEVSPRFGPASVYNSLPPSQTEKLLRYRISVNYAQKL